ncbi:choice-of-anchor L domain-containing protein [Flavobacteriales bacterium]|nr:choice-of-anchor L domain-containing protein [Flavobacteriales bacterium]
MTRKLHFTFLLLATFACAKLTFAQITTSTIAPYNSQTFLVDSVLLGDGVLATNHSYQGDPNQIGFFNGVNCNIGIDSGIVLATGSISELEPGNFGGFIVNGIDDPDLLDLANSVPELIGQNFNVSSVNDVAILEFDFVPVSSYLSFKYVFASQEYFAYENTQYNDVFGFFISGPGIVGPYDSPGAFPDGSINIATFQSVEPNSLGVDLPITISSVNANYNSLFFVNNQNNGNNTVNPSNADGFTTVFTAEADVVCGELYHIKLAIADGTDTGLSSFVLLEAGSFSSPRLEVSNSLDVDSIKIFTDCGAPVELTAEVQGNYTFLWNNGDTTQTITATPGYYWVEATDEFGCTTQSDSLRVYSQPIPEIILPDTAFYCENSSLVIDPEINSGTAPFYYNWGGLSTDSTLTVSSENIFSLTITDSNGCGDTHEITIIEQPIPDLFFEPQDILVCGGTPVEVSVSGASTYQWSPNLYLSSDTGSTVMTTTESSLVYTVTGTDSIGCSNTLQIPTTATDLFNIQIGIDPVSCQGFNDGSITLVPENTAVSPLLFSIDGGQNYSSNFLFDELEFGTYEVKIKDGLGCINTDTAIVPSAAPNIQVIAESTDVLCSGQNLGQIGIQTISGGNITSGYTYKWFNSSTNQIISTDTFAYVPAGGYYLVVEDDNGCQGTDEVSVEQPNSLSYEVFKNDISCFGASDGSIEVLVYGGATPPYSYNWTNYGNDTSSVLYNLSPGTYTLEISDFYNCITHVSVDITQANAPLTVQSSTSSINCFGDQSGSASVEVSGGSLPYSYNWSSGHVTQTATQLVAGTYVINVTDNKNCVVSDTVQISGNPEIVTSLSSTPTSCFGLGDGTATVSASGGTGPLTYTWSNGSTASSITSNFGNYWVKVEDNIGCFVIDTILINQPQKLRVTLRPTDALCYGSADGQITAHVNGGTPAYTYAWSINGNPFGVNNDSLVGLPQTNQPYQLNVTDANGCSQLAYAFINHPAELIADEGEIVSAYCQNIPSGDASVLVSGGFLNTNGSYSYNWNTGDTLSVISDKVAGSYTVIVKDNNACTDTLSLEIPLVETFMLSATSDSLNCFEDGSGSATVVSTGGYGPYSYQWNTSSGSIQQTSNANSNTILDLEAGVTSVVVTDVNGCAKTTQTYVGQPSELLFTIFKNNDESCSGDQSSCDGELEVIASGGMGMFTVSVIDGANTLLNSFTSSSAVTVPDLCSGFYQISVEDERGCVGVPSGSGILSPVEIVAGTPVLSSINTTPGSISNSIICYGDTAATLSVSNPNPSYTYQWFVDGQFTASGSTATLPAGDISVRAVSLSDTSCYTNSSEVTIYQPSEINISQEVSAVSCFGGTDGSIDINAFGGTPGYTYSWSSNGSFVSDTTYLSSLTSGSYVLSLTDANACVRLFGVEVLEPSLIEGVATVTDALCNGESDGSAEISVSGGVSPHFINWQGLDSTALSAGTYSVVLTDANSCEVSLDVEVNEPSALQANFSVSSIPFSATASGGTPNYSYDWLYFGNYQSSGTTFTPDLSGEYTLVVTDANGCEKRVMRDYTKVGVDEFSEFEVLIYPNPAKEYFTVELLGNTTDEEYTFKLLDSRARVLREAKFNNSLTIERRDLASGIYFIMIKSDGFEYQQKLMIND